MQPDFRLYYEAVRADQLFADALEEAHGARLAGDYRYQPDKDTPAVATARACWRTANKAWMDNMQACREARHP